MKRLFDLVFSVVALLLLWPLLLVIALVVNFTSSGSVFFHQTRVGLHGKEFKMHKFRTMRPDSETSGQLSLGDSDPRVTAIGHLLRRTKMDELPQLWNVLVGEMGIVGPRPEVPKYVAKYDQEQRMVLTVRPGLTSKASLEYLEEGDLLAASSDPERTYIEKVMPAKLLLDLAYVHEHSLLKDLSLVWRTVRSIFS